MRRCWFFIIVLLLTAAACAPTVKVKRWESAKYDIKGIRKVGFTNFNTRLGAEAKASYVIPTALESALAKNGYFEISPRVDSFVEPLVKFDPPPKDMLVIGKPNADAVVKGEVTAYYVDAKSDTRKVEREETTGTRSEIYYENGVQKTRDVPIKVKKVYHEPYLKKRALIDFSVDVINLKTNKSIGHGRFKDEKTVDAQGQGSVERIEGNDNMLSDVLEKLSRLFVMEMAPHQMEYGVEIKKIDQCEQAHKQVKGGDWDSALACWRGMDPPSAEAWYNVGVYYESVGDYKGAYDYYRRALQMKNDDFFVKAAGRANAYQKDAERLGEQVEK